MCPVSACVAHFGKNRWVQDRDIDQGLLGERAGWLVSLSRGLGNSRKKSRKEGVVSSFPSCRSPVPVSSLQFPSPIPHC